MFCSVAGSGEKFVRVLLLEDVLKWLMMMSALPGAKVVRQFSVEV